MMDLKLQALALRLAINSVPAGSPHLPDLVRAERITLALLAMAEETPVAELEEAMQRKATAAMQTAARQAGRARPKTTSK